MYRGIAHSPPSISAASFRNRSKLILRSCQRQYRRFRFTPRTGLHLLRVVLPVCATSGHLPPHGFQCERWPGESGRLDKWSYCRNVLFPVHGFGRAMRREEVISSLGDAGGRTAARGARSSRRSFLLRTAR